MNGRPSSSRGASVRPFASHPAFVRLYSFLPSLPFSAECPLVLSITPLRPGPFEARVTRLTGSKVAVYLPRDGREAAVSWWKKSRRRGLDMCRPPGFPSRVCVRCHRSEKSLHSCARLLSNIVYSGYAQHSCRSLHRSYAVVLPSNLHSFSIHRTEIFYKACVYICRNR